ncbi:Bacteriophage holin family [uncultured Caudovirales phage]|uniref:Bacteriophage holin family n=1 Tax=uncultured Caudovirales phage TaxID=2100421 RepID=A0A6J5M8D2_9CAUD|nr:Bacteriophage holin family [uncultured Caudovirales phage]
MSKDFTHFVEILKVYLHSIFNSISSMIDNLESLLKNLMLILLAFLAPVKSAILAVYFLILLDMITGVWASIKEKRSITSSGLSQTIGKILIYSTTIIVSFVVHKFLLVGFELPIEALVSGFIAITETKSIFENLNRISSNRVVKDLIILLSNERSKRLPYKKNEE